VKSPDLLAVIENLVRLRQLAAGTDPSTSDKVAAIVEDLERLVGPTVRPADAARALGISAPGLKRWLDNREIASVMTPSGRREVPLNELIELLIEVEAARGAAVARPLTHVIRARKRKAVEAVDVDRLLPRRPTRTHREAELQALAYHRLVAERLDASVVNRARRQLDRWRTAGRIDPRWAHEWETVLSRSIDDIRHAISADTPRARDLRQTSPFAGALSEQERRLLTAAVSARDPA
jgi:hypothetical protein